MLNLLRTPQAAARLGVSKSYLEKQRCIGTGPAYVKIGRLVAYREEDLIAWVATNVQLSTSASDALGRA